MAGYNSPFGSNSSTSSLLRSAASTQSSIQSYEDQVAAYNWDNSAKTEADFQEYKAYLDNRAQTTTDPSKQITYMNKVNSARSGFISNEIQRQSINVIEGAGSNLDKYNRMVDLFNMAADAGDYDQMQSLRLQLDNLDITIQNERKAAVSSSRSYASSYNKAIDTQVKDAVDQTKSDITEILSEYQRLGPTEFSKQNDGADALGLVYSIIFGNQDTNTPGLIDVYRQAGGLTTDPSKQQDYQQEFNSIVETGDYKLGKLPGGDTLTTNDIKEQIQAVSTGQTFLRTELGANGNWELKKNQITGYQYGRDESGNYKLMPIYASEAPTQSNFTKADGLVTDTNAQDILNNQTKGKDQLLTYSELLKNNNFDVTNNQGVITVVNNGQFNNAGIPQGTPVQLTVDASGNLQIINQGTPYQLNFDEKSGKFTGIEQVTPNPITQLPSGNQLYSRFNMPYLAQKLKDNPNFLDNLPGGSFGYIDSATAQQLVMEGGPLAKRQAVIQQTKEVQAQQQRIQAQQQAIQQAKPAQSILSAPAKATISLPKITALPKINLNSTANTGTVTINNKPNTSTVKVQTGGYTGAGISF